MQFVTILLLDSAFECTVVKMMKERFEHPDLCLDLHNNWKSNSWTLSGWQPFCIIFVSSGHNTYAKIPVHKSNTKTAQCCYKSGNINCFCYWCGHWCALIAFCFITGWNQWAKAKNDDLDALMEDLTSKIRAASTNISVICLTVVFKLTITMFISLYFQTFWPKQLKLFRSFQKNFRL